MTHSKLLSGDVGSRLFILALPAFVEQFLNFCVGIFDTFLAGRISADATSAIGLGAYVGWLASLLFSLVAIGTSTLVARHWGAGEFDEANRIANRSLALAALIGLAVSLLLYVVAPLFAAMQNMTGATAQMVIGYLQFHAVSHAFTSVSFVAAAALRGSGDTRSPMLILALVVLLNVLVSCTLTYGLGPFPALGVDGIVAGTVAARIAGALITLGVLAWGVSGLRLRASELHLRGKQVRRILRVGLPVAAEGGIMWTGHMLFLMIISRLATGAASTHYLAAHMIAIQVEALTYLPAVAWGHAAATMIGQSLGAGDRQRAVHAGHAAVQQCCLLGVVVTIAFFFGAPAIYSVMHTEQAVRDIGVPAFRVLSLFQIPLIVSIVYVAALRGAGDTRYPMLITICSVICVRLPLGYLGGITLNGGLLGAWAGMYGDVTVRALLAAIRYTRGRWVETRV